jgi:hemoglobin/transferrin/lactoferrin receptor protein
LTSSWNIEGGTPAPAGTIWGHFSPAGARWWVQPYLIFAGEQTHLSSLDLADRRTGAPPTRTQIQNFFRRGARNRGWINPGPDNVFGTAEDTLVQTGETLLQIQNRVLGTGVNSSNVWTAVPSYALVGIRFAVRRGPHLMTIDGENLTDQSYRGVR